MAANPPIQTQTAGIQAALPTMTSQVQAASPVPDVVSQPLPLMPDVQAQTAGVFDLTGMFLIMMFSALVYWGFKYFKQVKAMEARAKFKNSEFGDGFL